MTPRTRLGRLALASTALLATALIAGPAHAQPAAELTEEEVSFTAAERTIGGTVIAPADGETDRPGVVLVSGSGEGPLREYYRPIAEAFARQGIVALLYDKRDSSSGYDLFEASMTDLADDAIAAARFLSEYPGVDPDMVGLHGHSEGGWTVIEAGTRTSDTAFIITSGASAYTPDRTQTWMNTAQLEHAGVTEGLWRPFGQNWVRIAAHAETFRLAGHDPLPGLASLEQPVLGVFAEHDTNTPPGESLALFDETLRRSAHPNYSLRVITGVDHQMVPSDDGFYGDGIQIHELEVAVMDDPDPAYVDVVTSWIHGLADGTASTRIDPAPRQTVDSIELGPVAWYESAIAQLVALSMFLVLFASYPVAAAVRGARGRAALAAPASARVLACIGLPLPPLAVVYLIVVMMTAGTALGGPVILGRPLPWLVLQLAALALMITAAALTVRWIRSRGTLSAAARLRFAALLAGAVVFLPWGIYWGLFTI